MGNVVNLRLARKRLKRDGEARRADENRLRHGQTKAEKLAARNAARRTEALLDGHLRENLEQDGKPK